MITKFSHHKPFFFKTACMNNISFYQPKRKKKQQSHFYREQNIRILLFIYTQIETKQVDLKTLPLRSAYTQQQYAKGLLVYSQNRYLIFFRRSHKDNALARARLLKVFKSKILFDLYVLLFIMFFFFFIIMQTNIPHPYSLLVENCNSHTGVCFLVYIFVSFMLHKFICIFVRIYYACWYVCVCAILISHRFCGCICEKRKKNTRAHPHIRVEYVGIINKEKIRLYFCDSRYIYRNCVCVCVCTTRSGRRQRVC